jgi:hypothetical protein
MAGCESHDAAEYVEDSWQWLSEKMGDGFGGVFVSDDPSPSGKFDRVTKDKFVEIVNEFYESNEEYRELVDEVWEYNDTEEEDGVGEDRPPLEDDGVRLFDSTHIFYDGHNGSKASLPDADAEPDVSAFKYYMKMYAVNTDGIPSDDDSPSADAFVDEWLDYIEREALTYTVHICSDRSERHGGPWNIPTHDDISCWAREMFKNDSEFKENVLEKWGVEIEDDDEKEEPEPHEVSEPQKKRKVKREKQSGIGDFA